MTAHNSQSDATSMSLPRNRVTSELSQFESSLVFRARMGASEEASAAIAHQLNEPLTALLFYLHDLKAQAEHSADAPSSGPMTGMVEKALKETERACDILARTTQALRTSPAVEAAIARGREAIANWAQDQDMKGASLASSAQPDLQRRILTPREQEVLVLIAEGDSNKEGGHKLGISPRTFEVHRARIIEKVGARNTADLIRKTMSRPE